MTKFHMKNRCKCDLERPKSQTGISCRFVERTRMNAQQIDAGNERGCLFLSDDTHAFDEYRDYKWFGNIKGERDEGKFDDGGDVYSYLFFSDVCDSFERNRQSERNSQLFDKTNGDFIELLKYLKETLEVFPNYCLDTLYRYKRHLVIIPINVAAQTREESYDPFYRLGVIVLNYLYNNKMQYILDDDEIDALRNKLRNDNNVSEVYRFVLLRIIERRPQLRFGDDIDIVELCQGEIPNKCEYVKQDDGVICKNNGDRDHIQVFSIGGDEREKWEKLREKLIPVCELPSVIDPNKEVGEDEERYIWRAGKSEELTTELVVPVSYRTNRCGSVGLWTYVGSVFQFSNIPDVIFYELGGRFQVNLNRRRVLNFSIYWPRNVPRCRLTARSDRYANYPNEEGNLLDKRYVCICGSGGGLQTLETDLKELKFPLYFRVFSEIYVDGECFSLGEDTRSRFFVESEDQIRGNQVCLPRN